MTSITAICLPYMCVSAELVGCLADRRAYHSATVTDCQHMILSNSLIIGIAKLLKSVSVILQMFAQFVVRLVVLSHRSCEVRRHLEHEIPTSKHICFTYLTRKPVGLCKAVPDVVRTTCGRHVDGCIYVVPVNSREISHFSCYPHVISTSHVIGWAQIEPKTFLSDTCWRLHQLKKSLNVSKYL